MLTVFAWSWGVSSSCTLFSFPSVCLSGDDTMRHDTYLLRWRLQNTTTEQIHENVVLALMGACQLTSPRFFFSACDLIN